MWGNRLGWCISAALVALFGATVYGFEAAKATTAPTALGRDPATMESVALPVAPGTVVAMTESRDAGPLYRRVVERYRADDLTYDRLAQSAGGRSLDAADAAALPAFAPLIEATPLASATLFADDPAAVVSYKSDPPDLAALRAVGLAAANTALRLGKSDPARARELYEAAFSLGAKLFAERLTYAELQAGLELMSTASAGLADWAAKQNDADLAIKVKLFDDARKGYAEQRLAPAWRAISSVDPAVNATHAGDVFAFAEGSREPMWRTEALLKLGRLRYSAARIGDKAAAARVARARADNSETDAEKLAAAAARDLTLIDFRRLN